MKSEYITHSTGNSKWKRYTPAQAVRYTIHSIVKDEREGGRERETE